MDFSLSFKPGDIKSVKCEKCGQEIKQGEKLVMDRKTIHNSCYKCSICGKQLQHGQAGLDNGLCRYGIHWLCREHLLLDPTTKEQMLQQKGFKMIKK